MSRSGPVLHWSCGIRDIPSLIVTVINLTLFSSIGGVSLPACSCWELWSVAPQDKDPRAGSLGRATSQYKALSVQS
ncbi:hypothetical protein FOBRF1_005267 [Fusarium oxysporum]